MWGTRRRAGGDGYTPALCGETAKDGAPERLGWVGGEQFAGREFPLIARNKGAMNDRLIGQSDCSEVEFSEKLKIADAAHPDRSTDVWNFPIGSLLARGRNLFRHYCEIWRRS